MTASHGWFLEPPFKTICDKSYKEVAPSQRQCKGQRSASITGGVRGNAETWRGTYFDKLRIETGGRTRSDLAGFTSMQSLKNASEEFRTN